MLGLNITPPRRSNFPLKTAYLSNTPLAAFRFCFGHCSRRKYSTKQIQESGESGEERYPVL